jgi:hypothetical protein
MHAAQYVTRGRKHMGSTWSRVTCLDSPLIAAQTLSLQVHGDSQSRWQLMITIGNKQYKQINKIVNQTLPKV